MKKYICLLLSCVLILSLALPAAAATVNTTQTFPSESSNTTVSPRASSIPTSPHSLPYNMRITNLDERSSTYSLYYFSTDTEHLRILGSLSPDGTEDGVARQAKIFLYKVGSSEIVDSYTTATFTDTVLVSHTFINLDPDAYYYFRIQNLTATTILAERSIWGDINIDAPS